ncbi:M20/M25/M40 family metallo-hydrolase [Planctomycetaceae bacterium SH139]
MPVFAPLAASFAKTWVQLNLPSTQFIAGVLVALLGLCGSLNAQDADPADPITDTVVRSHIQFLADDLLEGRGPGSRGDALTQLYLQTQFKLHGLKPVFPGDSWVQAVPLVGSQTRSPDSVTVRKGADSIELKNYDDVICSVGRPVEQVKIEDAEIVFVGYGIVAPEYDWDDYKGVDLSGKILLMMNNDPSDDPELFAGRRRLYYGRWDYKYAAAAAQGAAGAIIIHTTPSAGYPFQVVQTSWSGEEFELRAATGPRMELKSWVSDDAAKRIASLAGHDLDALRAAAESRDFQPVPLGTTLSVDLSAAVRGQETANVVGVLPGADPKLKDQYVVVMAHHDHLGMSDQRDARGDNIYNGAIDNASGTAGLLTILKAFTELPEPPARSILFAAVGAEEQGLLGSKHFAEFPPVPAGAMAAVINIDGLSVLGRSYDVNVIGSGKSSLDEIVKAVAVSQDRIVTPDAFPDRGYYYRSDQFSLARIGVPGVYLHAGTRVRGKPDNWGKEQLDKWVQETYHQPSDEYREDWDLSGAIEDLQLLFHVSLRVANQSRLPTWTPGDEFEAARKAALRELESQE